LEGSYHFHISWAAFLEYPELTNKSSKTNSVFWLCCWGILFDEGIGDKRIGLQIQLVDKYNKNTNTEIPEGKNKLPEKGKR
jgi:hypothetical protein